MAMYEPVEIIPYYNQKWIIRKRTAWGTQYWNVAPHNDLRGGWSLTARTEFDTFEEAVSEKSTIYA